MAWATDLTEEIRISYTTSVTRIYMTRVIDGLRRYRTQSFWTSVDEYRNMDQATCEAHIAGLSSDTSDANGNRTTVTCSIQRQNDAGAYKIVKTTAFLGSFDDWSAYA